MVSGTLEVLSKHLAAWHLKPILILGGFSQDESSKDCIHLHPPLKLKELLLYPLHWDPGPGLGSSDTPASELVLYLPTSCGDFELLNLAAASIACFLKYLWKQDQPRCPHWISPVVGFWLWSVVWPLLVSAHF